MAVVPTIERLIREWHVVAPVRSASMYADMPLTTPQKILGEYNEREGTGVLIEALSFECDFFERFARVLYPLRIGRFWIHPG